MACGFVYLLGNKAMPCYYKIGCTERSPHARAKELAAASGVPLPFDVMLYIEVEEFQRVERMFHREMADFRARFDREFFCFGPAHMNWLWYAFKTFESKLSFVAPRWHAYAGIPQFPGDYEEAWILNNSMLSLPDAPPLEPGNFNLVVA